MAHLRHHLTLAWYVLDLASLDQLQKWADTILSEGVYSYSLGELFGYSSFSTANPKWLFENAVSELGMTLPSRGEAALQIAGDHLVGIVEGNRPPADGLTALRNALGYPFQAGNDLIMAAGCHELVRFAYEYEDHFDIIESHRAYQEARQLQELDGALMPLIQKWIHDRFVAPFEPHWRTTNVSQLAEAVAESKAFERLPILADALEEAGCTNQHILDHCRDGGAHVCGCWVVDLILGKK